MTPIPNQSQPLIKLITLLCFSAVRFQTQLVTAQSSSSPPPPPPDPFGRFGSGINPTMAVVMVILVASFFLMGFFSVYLRQCAHRRLTGRYHSNQNLARGRFSRMAAAPRGLDTDVIESFPIFLYSTVRGVKLGQDSLECAVCLNEFEDDETLRLIPICSHVFHPDCIDSWLASHVTCPVCRADLALESGEIILTDPVQDVEPVPVHDGNRAEEENEVSVRVDESLSKKSNPFRSRSTGSTWGFNKTSDHQSQSRGNLFVRSDERFTLRLPEEIQSQLVNSSLNRSRSCVAFTRVTSTRKGYRRSGSMIGSRRSGNLNYERFDQLEPGRFKFTPSFFTRTGSVGTNDGERSSDHLRSNSYV